MNISSDSAQGGGQSITHLSHSIVLQECRLAHSFAQKQPYVFDQQDLQLPFIPLHHCTLVQVF